MVVFSPLPIKRACRVVQGPTNFYWSGSGPDPKRWDPAGNPDLLIKINIFVEYIRFKIFKNNSEQVVSCYSNAC